jgi:hypothetical protein
MTDGYHSKSVTQRNSTSEFLAYILNSLLIIGSITLVVALVREVI